MPSGSSRQAGSVGVPITDKNGRGREVNPMAPHEAQRYKIRSSAERANSRLKEDFGANNVMVRRNGKVTQHLMFVGHLPVCRSSSSPPRISCQRAKRIIYTQWCKLFILQKALTLKILIMMESSTSFAVPREHSPLGHYWTNRGHME